MFYDNIFLKEIAGKWVLSFPVIWDAKDLFVIPKGFSFKVQAPKWMWWKHRRVVALIKYVKKLGIEHHQKKSLYNEATAGMSRIEKYLLKKVL